MKSDQIPPETKNQSAQVKNFWGAKSPRRLDYIRNGNRFVGVGAESTKLIGKSLGDRYPKSYQVPRIDADRKFSGVVSSTGERFWVIDCVPEISNSGNAYSVSC